MAQDSTRSMSVLGLEIGSANTHAFLFDVVEDNYRLIASAVAPSTHVEPFFDLGDAVFEVVTKLQDVTGRVFFGHDARLIMPSLEGGEGVDSCVITTSCAGGLNLVAFGLLNEVSLESVKKLADSTYTNVAEIIGTTPQMPEIEWTNFMKTGAADSGDQGYVYGPPGTLKRRARGTIPLGPPFSIKGAMPDAPQAAARFLREELTSAGISVSGNPISSNAPASRGRVLATIVSPPMRDVMRVLNKQSFNLYAEMFLMHLGKKAGAESRTDAIKVEEQWLKEMGVDLTGVYILDGSGLSRGNLVTAKAMAQMMCGLRDRPNFQVWRDTLPVLGVDGKSGKDLPIRGRVQAKTGYIERVRGLTGYLQAKSGRELTFALFANAYANKMSDVDKDFEAILMAFYEKY